MSDDERLQIEAQAAEIKQLREALSDILTRFDPWSPGDYIADKAARVALGDEMIDDKSEPGSWKLALQLGPWRKTGKNTYTNAKEGAPVADRPNAEDYRNRAERAEAECQELRAKLDRIYAILKEDV
ncbi:MAG: hypothetical protein ACO3S3_12510 [Pseudohongiellaceae bacterium]